MRVRKLTADKDYSFGNGSLDFYFNVPAAVGQNVETGLMLWLGEWFLDITLGMPWIQGVLGKHSQEVQDGTIQNQVISTTGVTDISSYESIRDDDARTLKVIMTIDTIYGETDVQVQNSNLF